MSLQYAISLLRQNERAISTTIATYRSTDSPGDLEAAEYWRQKLDSVQAAIDTLNRAHEQPPPATTKTYCLAEADRAHETFQCLEADGHPPPHRGPAVPPPCPTCDGLERHADECALLDTDDDNAEGDMVEVVWDADGAVRLEPLQ